MNGDPSAASQCLGIVAFFIVVWLIAVISRRIINHLEARK